ncbi:50S ribosomal protein L10 [Coxiella endosymbiont of Amblyomma americanum]|uniref:50S ribosomal protein L10 n=1 Tax=Coxiella endosymbiont of Amblyomma americanum TaxID=325775 RepID=UPI00057E4331|nr:50S ribosomal protein L10 [Coxiella endosymbiont of Amblyomma americanum]AJC50414.1 50S ribosomal protein L10 [Coxiella endosymbiont of Amblyomma americanum]AUJ58755.1 50S ribosomal protein L10 [Coxiella-like endosymbiont of Amblyomma americanum]
MALNITQKRRVVADLSKIIRQSVSVIAVNYRGLTVPEISELRKIIRNSGVVMKVCRNTLAYRAFKGTPYSCLDTILTGPTALFFSQKEPGDAARLIETFIKEHEHLQVKALTLGKELLLPTDFNIFARMPSRKEALIQLSVVSLAIVIKFICMLKEPIIRVMHVVTTIQEKKASGEKRDSSII